MAKEKKTQVKGANLTIRISDEMSEKLSELEKATNRGRAELTRFAIEAMLSAFKEFGQLEFPLKVVPASNYQSFIGNTVHEVARILAEENKEDLIRQSTAMLQEAIDKKAAEFVSQLTERRKQLGLWVPPTEEDGSDYGIRFLGGIAAGSPVVGDMPEEVIPVEQGYPEDHYALRVFGTSMEPKIPDNSMIVVRQFQEKGFPKKGTIVVYNDGHGSTLKEFGYRKAKPGEEGDSFNNVPVLKSINPAFREVQTMEGGRIDAVFVEVL